MAIWAWTQPNDRVWKVLTDRKQGTIKVFNEKDVLVMVEEGLSLEGVSMIEENFLEIVGVKLTDDEPENACYKIPEFPYPMYA